MLFTEYGYRFSGYMHIIKDTLRFLTKWNKVWKVVFIDGTLRATAFEIRLPSSPRLSAVLLSAASVPKRQVWTENIKWKISKINNSQKF